MAASLFFKSKGRLLLVLPRQYGGKTELGVRLLYDLTVRPFATSSLFLAKDKKSGKKMTREKFIRLFDQKKFAVNTEQTYLKECPTSIIFQDSVDKEPDRIRGGTYSMIHWAEVAFSKLPQGETIIGVFQKVIEPTLTQTDGYVLLESTLNGPNGFKELWDKSEEFDFARLKVSFSQMCEWGLVTWEEYEKVKKRTLPDIFRQEYECEWVTFRGRAYPEFDEDNKWANMAPPESWQKIVSGLDWGYHPSATCVLFAYIRDGIIYVFAEIYSTHQKPTDTKDSIEARLNHYQIPKNHWVGAGDHEQDRNDALIDFGLTVVKADKRSVFGSRMKIKERLWKKTLVIDPIACPNLVRDLEAAVWDDKKDGEIDYNICSWGHFDGEAALRYLIEECSNVEEDEPVRNPHETDVNSAHAWLEQQRFLKGT